jgi:hypothetical protein
MTIYKCFKNDFEELTKKINRITKKLDKYSYKWTFENLGESIQEVNVIDYRNINNVPAWQFHPKNLGKKAVEIISYTFEMESLKLGEYEVIAVLEHNAIENSQENLIHIIKEEIIIPLQYRNVKSICEHCNSDRQRNKTVLLQDTNGNIKQVGTTCIKEYTGIDGIDIINYYQDIHDIIIEDLEMDYDNINYYPKCDSTLNYLSACIQLIIETGYDKETTKFKAWEIAGTDKQDKKYFEKALQVIEYFKNSTFDESQNFLQNIKLYLSQKYTKISGFIAYAYIAYQKQIEYEQKKQAEKEGKKQSEFIGTTGQKLEIELTFKKRIAYETSYNGYNEMTQYIYLFEDIQGNVYKWNTAKFIEKEINNHLVPIQEGEQLKLKGTIKEHKEYKEQKQTVLTRCKVL